MLPTDSGVQIYALGRKRGFHARGRTLPTLRVVLEDVLDNAIDRYQTFECPCGANPARRPWVIDHGNAKDFRPFSMQSSPFLLFVADHGCWNSALVGLAYLVTVV